MLTYEDLSQMFPQGRKFIDPSIKFHTVTAFASIRQSKGIFIPLYNDSGELSEAIENGAIGALWKEGTLLPKYTPNSFFVFYTKDLWKGINSMLKYYEQKLITNNESKGTQFLIEDHHTCSEDQKNGFDIPQVIKRFEIIEKEMLDEGRE